MEYMENQIDYETKEKRLNVIVTSILLIAFLIYLITVSNICISTYNNLVECEENVKKAQADVENMMQRRLEVIPGLVEIVKAYSEHEQAIFEDITVATDNLEKSIANGNLEKITEANENVSITINGLLKTIQSYPEIKAHENYISLMDSLEGSVNRIAVKRAEYNDQVSEYNKLVRKFPGVLLAKIFGFEELETFKADKAAEETLKLIDFDN